MDMVNVSKLTVTKLRGLCKESGLSNYSKLPKAALLAKLEGAGLVSVSGKPVTSSTSSKPTKENRTGKCINLDILEAETSSDSVGSSMLNFSTTLSVCVEENLPHQEPSTGINLCCDTLPDPSPMQNGNIIEHSLLAMKGSKRSNEVAFSTTPKIKNAEASKRPKVSSELRNHLKGLTVPESRSRFRQGLPDKNLDIYPPQPQSTIQPPSSTSISALSSSQLEIHCQGASQGVPTSTPTTAHRPFIASPALPNDQSTVSQRTASSDTGFSPLHRNGSALGISALLSCDPPPSRASCAFKQPKFNLSRNFVTPSCNSWGSSVLAGSSVNAHSSQAQKLKFNAPRPSTNLRRLDKTQGHVPHQQSPVISVCMSQVTEASILLNLEPISLPPSISQRRRLPLLSLALSYLTDDQRMVCVLVSKLFRYAGKFSFLEISVVSLDTTIWSKFISQHKTS